MRFFLVKKSVVSNSLKILLTLEVKMGLTAEGGLFTENEWQSIVKGLSLSRRQAQVIWALLQGDGDKQIAFELGITVPTIRTYLTRLFDRFEVQDRNELVLYVFRYFRQGCYASGCPRQ